MSTARLTDLRVEWTYPQGAGHSFGEYEGTRSRPATVDDLVSALIEKGGEEVEVSWQKHLRLVNAKALVEAVGDNPGRYLVFRLPDVVEEE